MRLILKPLLVWGLLSVAAAVGVSAAGELPLVEAVKNKNLDTVRGLLKQRVDVNAAEGDGTTALHWAVHRDDLASTELLLRAGARANTANDTGVTPLFLACTNRNGAMVERLLAASANPNAALLNGETVLMQCALAGDLKAVKALLTHGAQVNAKESTHAQTALMWAAGQGHAQVVQALIEAGADVRARSRMYPQLVTGGRGGEDQSYQILRGGSSPLLFAVRSGDVESAKALLAAGADVNDASPSSVSALVQAAHSGHDALAAFLLEKGADPNNISAGYTALHAAVLRSDVSLVRALLDRGADPNAVIVKGTPIRRDSQDFDLPASLVGATPYFLAAKFLEVDIMPVLAAGGANPRTPIPGGMTPLMAAAGVGVAAQVDRYGHHVRDGAKIPPESRVVAAVRHALALGSDLNAASEDGNTALHAAAVQGFDDVVRLLVESGAEVNPRNRRGQTPLSALVRGSGGRLLASGALNIPDPHPTTALLLRTFGAVE